MILHSPNTTTYFYYVAYFYCCQDGDGPGTVLSHNTVSGWVEVKWDNGLVAFYIMKTHGVRVSELTKIGVGTTPVPTYSFNYKFIETALPPYWLTTTKMTSK